MCSFKLYINAPKPVLDRGWGSLRRSPDPQSAGEGNTCGALVHIGLLLEKFLTTPLDNRGYVSLAQPCSVDVIDNDSHSLPFSLQLHASWSDAARYDVNAVITCVDL